jgi:hypothetical protein
MTIWLVSVSSVVVNLSSRTDGYSSASMRTGMTLTLGVSLNQSILSLSTGCLSIST